MVGIESEDSYPDDPSSHECRFNPKKVAVRYTRFSDIISGKENAQIPVAIDASHASFQLYKSGGMYFP
jgi:hypothetical protein